MLSQSAAARRLRLVRLPLALLAAVLAAVALAPSASAASAGEKQAEREFTLLVQLHHPEGLADLVRAVSDPKSPDYGNYPTVEAIVGRFGAPPAAKKATMQWLREHGAKAKLGPTGTYVVARVPAHVAAYALPKTGGSGAAAADPRRVPAKLRGVVSSISALGTRPGAFAGGVEASAAPSHAVEPGFEGTSILPHSGTASGCPEGREAPSLGGTTGFAPNQYLEAYGHSNLQRHGQEGQGKDIAVVEIDGFRRSDVDTFAACFGLPKPNLVVRPVGVPKPLPPGDETTLDLEVLSAVAPKLDHTYVYEGLSSQQGVLFSVAAALGAPGHHPDAISISLGACEAGQVNQIGFDETLDEVFAVADAAGISVLVAAGDAGSSTCKAETEEGLVSLPFPSASVPGTSPFVTAVGGTNFELSKKNRIKGEIVWNDYPVLAGAGGGGASILTSPRPWWQQGILNGAGTGRLVPDVAGLADIVPGYSIYCTAAECKDPEALPEGGWQTVGGTSAATPLYAGGVILADGYATVHAAPPLGFLNPLLYELGREARAGKSGGNVLRDVTQGNDDPGPYLPKSIGGGKPLECCTANVGYDQASGWGSLDVANLAKVATARLGAARARAAPKVSRLEAAKARKEEAPRRAAKP